MSWLLWIMMQLNGGKDFLEIVISCLFDIYPEVGLLGHRVVLFLMAVPIYISTNRSQGSLFSTSTPALLSCLFDNCYLNKCEVVSVAWFAFPWYLRMLSTFSCSCWPFVHLLWKNSYSGPYVNFLIGFFAVELYSFLIYFEY